MATTKDQDAPQTRRERRWSRNAQKGRERREVRTSNGRQRSTRPVVIQVGGPKRRRRRPKLRSKKYGVLAGIWLVLSATLTIAWLTLGGTLWVVGTGLTALAGVMAAVAAFDPESVVPTQPRRRSSTTSPRATGKTGTGGSSAGTRTRKRSPVKPKRRVCSARCQASTKDVSTCECVCGGKSHGSRKLKSVS